MNGKYYMEKDVNWNEITQRIKREYPKFPDWNAWSEDCKCYSSLPVGEFLSLFCESV
jgi:hypothetical protein